MRVLLLLWLVLSVLVRVLDKVLKEAGGAGGAGGGGGALPFSLGTVSSSLDSGMAGRGAEMALLLSGVSVDVGESSGLLACCADPL